MIKKDVYLGGRNMNKRKKILIIASSIVMAMPFSTFGKCVGDCGCSGMSSQGKEFTQMSDKEKNCKQESISLTQEQKKTVIEEMMKVIEAEKQAIENLYKKNILTKEQRDKRLERVSKKEANIKENGFPIFKKAKHKGMDR